MTDAPLKKGEPSLISMPRKKDRKKGAESTGQLGNPWCHPFTRRSPDVRRASLEDQGCGPILGSQTVEMVPRRAFHGLERFSPRR